MKKRERAAGNEVSWEQIEPEFRESFGYLRDDLGRLREKREAFGYTATFLICCTCESLACHQGLAEDEIFKSLLPTEEAYLKIARSMFVALRNGLAHQFRPRTIVIGNDHYRFSVNWGSGRHLLMLRGDHGGPHWLLLDLVILCSGALSAIDDYEKRLKEDGAARCIFDRRHSRKLVTKIHESAVAEAWRRLIKKAEPC